MTREQMARVMNDVFDECKQLRNAGQQEYARSEEDAFANFKRLEDIFKVSKEKILFIYMYKHIDGIASYIDGHRSQREDVRGRINDAIVYLCILRGMIQESVEKDLGS